MHVQYKLDLKKFTGAQAEILELEDDKPKILVLDDPLFRCIKLQFENNQEISMGLYITFEFHSDDITLETAVGTTEPLLENIINILSFKLDVSISDWKIYAYNTVEGCLVASGSFTMYKPDHYVLPELDYSWLSDNLKSSTPSQKLKNSSYFQMYKSILLVENVTSRFLLLYSLLYEIKKNQYRIDRYIKKKEPKVKMIPSKKKNKKGLNLETIYTWWRNQSQHMQTDTSLNDIIKNYSELIDGLQLIVFQAIIESLNLPPDWHSR